MGKGKLAKFAEMEQNPLVVQCPFWVLKQDGFAMKGQWNSDFFHNDNPIVLELGCGRGEYTVGLARRYPEKNFIGVDIKGARMWHGAQTALKEGLTNVGFLRTSIEFIHEFFSEDEVSEIWLTFSDPQMKKATKRLTSTYFMQRYRQMLTDGGLIHLKTDSPFLYTYTSLMAQHNQLPVLASTDDLYGKEETGIDDPSLREIQTYYEQMWLERGFSIKYLCFCLPREGQLEEPDEEIPVDGYRSYHHDVRSTKTTAK
jgi:tRNA (guanine-N7-)-methyltransferase